MQGSQRAQSKVGALAENIAGALAYFTFIAAIIFLFRPPYNRNRFVRFHSWQCISLWLAAVVIGAVLRLASLLIFLIPVLGPLLVMLASVLAALALALIWVVVVVKALQGEMFELPVLGAVAERYAEPL